VVLEGPSRVEASRESDDAGGQTIDARHDGYARRYGAVHRRVLRLAADGGGLRGEDWILPARKTAALPEKMLAVRFHLHPAVRAEMGADPGSVVLTLPSGEEWRFEAAGSSASLEESIFFAAPGGTRPTTQIVLQAGLTVNAAIRWSFRRSQPTGATDRL
jgi:uncharacterized heparinase superfamily protein